MDIEKVIKAFENNEYIVKYFQTKEEAAAYIDSEIDGKVVGFGDSETLASMKMYELLAAHNTVYDPMHRPEGEGFKEEAIRTLVVDVFLTSVNALTENGEMVNIDGTGNRVAGSLFGHDKVYFVAGVNKICPTLDDAIKRARNIAAPLNSIRHGYCTPCAEKGDKCYDCHSKDRICNVIAIYLQKMNRAESELVLINESLGL